MVKKRNTTPIIETEHAERIGRYIEAYRRLCRKTLARTYKDAYLTLLEWGVFQAEFGEGGAFAGLDGQYASDAKASGMTLEHIALLEQSLTDFVTTIEEIERLSPGMFGISIPQPPTPEPDPEPEPEA